MPKDAIVRFCDRHHIQRLALFGSVLRDDFGPDSDVDVLVQFKPGGSPGWDFFRMQDELTEMLGRRVDLCTPGFLPTSETGSFRRRRRSMSERDAAVSLRHMRDVYERT